MEEEFGFCTRCGTNIAEGMEYCPECGNPLTAEAESARYDKGTGNPLIFFIFMLAIYCVMSMAEGVYTTVFSEQFIANIEAINGQNMTDYLARMGLDSVEHLEEIMFKEGVVSIIDGALVAVVLLLCLKRKWWKVAFILCIVASFVLLAGLPFMTVEMMSAEALSLILQTAIGLLIARGIYLNRNSFN